MKRILTCTDGSAYSASIYDLTAWVARRTKASVQVLHMLDAHRERAEASDLSGNIGMDSGEALLEKLTQLEESKSRLAFERGKLILAEAQRHLTAAGVAEIFVEQQHGELVEAVVEKEANADLVVIGKRGESAHLAPHHLGSNLERVVRASIRPALVAPRAFVPIERFLIAYDGGPSIEKAIRFLMEQPLLHGVECHLLRAGKMDADAEWYLNETAAKLREKDYQVKVHAVTGSPDSVIAETIKRENIHLLVMGAYGHSRIRQFIIGSTTTSTVRTCEIPILMFR